MIHGQVWRSILLAGVVIVLLPLAAAATDGPESGSEQFDAAREVELDRGTLEMTVPDDVYAYHEVYVATASDVDQSEIKTWETASVEAETVSPGSVWDGDFSEMDEVFSGAGTVDFARFFDPGEYYVFRWGCKTVQDGEDAVPGDCRWLDPLYVNASEGFDILANELAVTYRGDRYEYNPDEESEHDWLLDGEETDLVVEVDDYVQFHPADEGEIVVTDKVNDPVDRAYNDPGDDSLLWQFSDSGSRMIRHIAGGDVRATIEVRDCGGQSWNGEECRDMYNLVAVPLNYDQQAFDTFFTEMGDVAFQWADDLSPLGRTYDDPRDVMKLHYLEPDDHYVAQAGPQVGEQVSLANPHTDVCWGPEPKGRCFKAPTQTCSTEAGDFSLDNVAEAAAQRSEFSGRYDDVVAMHRGDMRMWDMTEIPEDIADAVRDMNPAELFDAVGVYRDGYTGCGRPGTAAVISDTASDPVRTMGHELGHAMGICRTEGVPRDGSCAPALKDQNYHISLPGPFCLNDVSNSGDRDIMNYCKNRDDRYWGDPRVGGSPDNPDLPYGVVDSWMQHYIEGAEPPGDRGFEVFGREILYESVLEKIYEFAGGIPGKALDEGIKAINENGDRIGDTIDTIQDGIDNLNPFGDDDGDTGEDEDGGIIDTISGVFG